ncbi:Protein flp [Colletotrichum orbiculare MAFF 240422]|uniref:Protein flp n=1 Tax=Colletotrichum orbiculare (strain 104-T / ATCC 96160 / CBS 514.97 / LARS 414 / MAFF 240422) TaxID=1213857 RepID=N4VGW7_COLOR|nr:Protein flp [Colletotrichum orbiculare MAFF 240422]
MHFRLSLGVLALFFLYSVTLSAPTALPDVQTYYDLDDAAHKIKSQTLKDSGYRIISLSSYGTPPSNKYAAVWVKQEGNDFVTISGADIKSYQKWIKTWKSKGYAPTHVSASGPAKGAIYAAVMEKAQVGKWKQQCGLKDPEDLHQTSNIQWLVKDYSTYGTPDNRRYCVLVHENIGNAMETIFYETEGPADFAEIYEAELKKTFWRPAHLFVAEDGNIAPHFAGNSVGKWEAKTGLTAEELGAEIEAKQRQGGLYPIHIDGGGSGQEARFAVIFAETYLPEERKWTVTGKEGDPDMTERLDSIMKTWMQKNGVRQAQVAAAEKSEIIFERSYTWAESNRAIVQPDDVFLLASLSKMFVHAAIYKLIQAGKLEFKTRVYQLLGYTQPKDPGALDTNIMHLLNHSTGYDRFISGDTGFQFRQASDLFHDNKRPADLRDMIEYQLTKKLDFKPGSKFSYSNYGSMLLQYVVSNITEQPFYDYLKENILEGLDVRVYETAAEKHANDRIIQDTRLTGLDALHPESSKEVSRVFGGDGSIREECAGAFGLAASASTIAKFIGTHAAWGTGERRAPLKRQGTLAGARTYAASETSGIDWAVTLNTRDFTTADEVATLRFKLLQPLFEEPKDPKSCFSWLRKFCAGA